MKRSQTGAGLWGVEVLAILAEVYADAERYTEALEHLEASLAEGRRTGERWREAEVHRLLGELLLRMSPAAHHEAKSRFHRRCKSLASSTRNRWSFEPR